VRGLAEFAMRGRFRALLVTVLAAGSLMFCWISAAMVALVTLRRGVQEGARLLLWALLPAGALLLYYGEASSLTLLVGTMALALVLRSTVSLPLTMLASVAVGLVTGVGMMAFGGDMLDTMVQAFGQVLENFEQQLSANSPEPVVLARPTAVQIAGMMATGNAMMSVMCLLLARYWQAALYNPGGFGQEFKALALSPMVASILAVVAFGLLAMGLEYRSWAMVFLVPLTFHGLALVHARVAYRGQSAGWLVAFYLGWAVLDPVKMIVVLFALVDSYKCFRHGWSKTQGGDPGDNAGGPQ
jgi:hypothetical protein